MAKNSYPVECQRTINQFSPLAARLASASGLSLDDLRQEIAAAWVAGLDPRQAVPAAVRVRRLRDGSWRSQDLAVAARLAASGETVEPSGEMPTPKSARGHLTASIAADAGIGRRAAQKRIKRQHDAAKRQGDLFGGWGSENGG
jgi:hypothetical protein